MAGIDDELNPIVLEFLGYLPYSEDSSIEVEAMHNMLKSIKALLPTQQQELLDRVIGQGLAYVKADYDFETQTWSIDSENCGAILAVPVSAIKKIREGL